jgi:hypothetical protein
VSFREDEKRAWIAFAQAAMVSEQLCYCVDSIKDDDTLHCDTVNTTVPAAEWADEMLSAYISRFGDGK